VRDADTLATLLKSWAKAARRVTGPAKPEGNAPWQEAFALADSYEVNDENQGLVRLDCSAGATGPIGQF